MGFRAVLFTSGDLYLHFFCCLVFCCGVYGVQGDIFTFGASYLNFLCCLVFVVLVVVVSGHVYYSYTRRLLSLNFS